MPSALAISTIWRRDSDRSRTSARGLTSSQRMRASSSSARRRCALRVDQAEAARRVGDRDVVRDRQVGHQRQFLEDADDAGAWRRRTGSRSCCGVPSRRMRAGSRAATTPAMILISVDLPAPFSPSTAWIEPRRQAKSTPSSARTPAIALGDAGQLRANGGIVAAGIGIRSAISGRRNATGSGGAGQEPAPPALSARLTARSSSVCAMIAGAGDVHAAGRELVRGEEVVRQVGPVVLAVLRASCSRRPGAAPRSAAASTLPSRAEMAALIEMATSPGDWPIGEALEALVGVLGDRACGSRSRPRPPSARTGCSASISACTVPVEPPWVITASNCAVHGERVGRHLLRGAVVPVADDLDDLEACRRARP